MGMRLPRRQRMRRQSMGAHACNSHVFLAVWPADDGDCWVISRGCAGAGQARAHADMMGCSRQQAVLAQDRVGKGIQERGHGAAQPALVSGSRLLFHGAAQAVSAAACALPPASESRVAQCLRRERSLLQTALSNEVNVIKAIEHAIGFITQKFRE